MQNIVAEPGLYLATIKDTGLDQSGKDHNGNYQFWLKILVRGKYASADDPTSDITYLDQPLIRYIRLTFTDKAFDISVRQLKTLGFAGTSFKQLDRRLGDASAWDPRDQDFVAYCKLDTYQGKELDRWSVAKPPPKPMDAAKVDHLEALFGSRLADFQATADKSTADIFEESVGMAEVN